MKVLFINESTRIKGGVDTILELEINGLREEGIEVELFDFSHDLFFNRKMREYYQIVKQYFSEREKQKMILNKINSFKPNIIHFHNTYPFFRRPLWFDDFYKNIAVVQHLHNFYPFCLNSFFFKEGKICTECLKRNSFNSGKKKSCYDYSLIKTILVAYQRPNPNEWIKNSENVNLFLGVSQFTVDKYIEFGIKKNKIKKLYNAININNKSESLIEGDYVLFYGNIVYAKGVEIVCQLAERNKDIKFKIAGDGRDLKAIKLKFEHLSNLSFESYIDGKIKDEVIKKSRFIIFPSICWESFGLVILEALLFNKTIIISGLGGTSELVINNGTGFIVKDNNIESYENVIRGLWSKLINFKIDANSKEIMQNSFSKEKHIETLINYYKTII